MVEEKRGLTGEIGKEGRRCKKAGASRNSSQHQGIRTAQGAAERGTCGSSKWTGLNFLSERKIPVDNHPEGSQEQEGGKEAESGWKGAESFRRGADCRTRDRRGG